MLVRLKKQKGFSLVEMMVVLAIFSIITGVVIANIPKLRNKTSIDLVAQSIALHVRGAQVYGIGTRQIKNADGLVVTPKSFGIHFDVSENQKQFLLFADTSNDKLFNDNFDCAEGSECVEVYKLKNVQVDKILKNGNTPINEPIDIVYTRPRSEAEFCINGVCQSDISHITIQLVNFDEETRLIEVWRNGQIAVKK